MIIYHGSNLVIEHPDIKHSRVNNDYGAGFYCTESLELAREWACGSVVMRDRGDAICNRYEIELDSLDVLDLSVEHSILNWLAVLIQNRTFDLDSEIMQLSYDWIIRNFDIDISKADIIMGYRADDSYFTFARDFLSNTISLEKLGYALHFGDLGKQVTIKSERAYKRLEFRGYEVVDFSKYSKLYNKRDKAARSDYRAARSSISLGETYILDLMRR